MSLPSHLRSLAAGASKKVSVAIAAATTSGQIVTFINPEKVAIIIKRVFLVITTPSTGACTLDIGTATSSTSSDNLIDGVSVASAGIKDNITDIGTNGKARQLMAAGDYLTASVASGDANGLVADLYVEYMLPTGA